MISWRPQLCWFPSHDDLRRQPCSRQRFQAVRGGTQDHVVESDGNLRTSEIEQQLLQVRQVDGCGKRRGSNATPGGRRWRQLLSRASDKCFDIRRNNPATRATSGDRGEGQATLACQPRAGWCGLAGGRARRSLPLTQERTVDAVRQPPLDQQGVYHFHRFPGGGRSLRRGQQRRAASPSAGRRSSSNT